MPNETTYCFNLVFIFVGARGLRTSACSGLFCITFKCLRMAVRIHNSDGLAWAPSLGLPATTWARGICGIRKLRTAKQNRRRIVLEASKLTSRGRGGLYPGPHRSTPRPLKMNCKWTQNLGPEYVLLAQLCPLDVNRLHWGPQRRQNGQLGPQLDSNWGKRRVNQTSALKG